MPIFEYICESCEESFEKIIQRDEQVVCPSCNSAVVVKQYSRFGVSSGDQKYGSLPVFNSGGGCCGGSCGCKH